MTGRSCSSMLRLHVLLFTFLGCSSLALLPSVAGPAMVEEAASGQNIFSCSEDSNVVPSFTEERGGEGRARKMLLGNQRDDIPDFKQLKMLPSLTMVQRRELKAALESTRAQMQVLLTKMKQLRPKSEGARSAGRPGGIVDPQVRAQILQLRTQIQALRTKSWEEIKPKLTQGQLIELAAMRKGELQPATFNEPMTGGGRQ